jgi:hypothetical protein
LFELGEFMRISGVATVAPPLTPEFISLHYYGLEVYIFVCMCVKYVLYNFTVCAKIINIRTTTPGPALSQARAKTSLCSINPSCRSDQDRAINFISGHYVVQTLLKWFIQYIYMK